MVRAKRQRGTTVELQLIGFFRELSHDHADGPSLRESIGDVARPNEGKLVSYLRNGTLAISSPGPVWDTIDKHGPIGTASIRTDGVWAWPEVLAHYVEVYHVLLSREFLDHVARNNWQVPEVTIEQLRRLKLP